MGQATYTDQASGRTARAAAQDAPTHAPQSLAKVRPASAIAYPTRRQRPGNTTGTKRRVAQGRAGATFGMATYRMLKASTAPRKSARAAPSRYAARPNPAIPRTAKAGVRNHTILTATCPS